MSLRRTPKVFQTNYRPPQKVDWSSYRPLRPLLVILIFIVALWLVARLPIFSISQIEVVGSSDPSVTEELNVLKGRSIFSRLISETTTHLLTHDLTLQSLTCSRGLPHTLRCQVTLRSAAIGWKRGDTTYVLDQNGLVFALQSDRFPVSLVIEDRGTSPVEVGKVVASNEAITAYQSISSALQEKGFALSTLFINDTLYQISVVTSSNNQPEVNWTPKQPVTVLMVINYPINDQVAALLQAVKDKKDKITSQVDVRVPGYVYVK